jgi:hypothetical protein
VRSDGVRVTLARTPTTSTGDERGSTPDDICLGGVAGGAATVEYHDSKRATGRGSHMKVPSVQIRFYSLATAVGVLATIGTLDASAAARFPAPTHLKVVAVAPHHLTLKWKGHPSAVAYKVYRGTTFQRRQLKREHVFQVPSCNTVYRLGVRAVYRAGSSAITYIRTRSGRCPVVWHVTPNGSDSNPCTKSKPCATFERAYEVAHLGDRVSIAAGTYPGQLIDQGAKSATGWVTFEAQPGAVLTDELRLNGVNDLRFVGLVRSDDYTEYSHRVQFIGGSEQSFYIRSSIHVLYRGVKVGNLHDGTSPTIGALAANKPSRYITLDHVVFHGIDRRDNPSGHVQCLFLQESDHVSIIHTAFKRCAVMDLYMHAILGGENPTDVLISADHFGTIADDLGQGHADGFYALETGAAVGETMANITFQKNSYGDQRAEVNTDGTIKNFRWCDPKSELAVSGSHGSGVITYHC